ncbi:MAG: DUF2384 domain-containing protein [Betaproteobacteria bacterium]|nr:DUF2384 domain-containing protein [Betaproteobacteria bacterium]
MNMPTAARHPAPEPVGARSPAAGAAALRTFFRIAEAWGLSTADQLAILGLRSRTTLNAWKKGGVGALSPDALERLSYVFGIYKALRILLPTAGAADAWIAKPNAGPLFGGGSALDRLRGGKVADLFLVRQYLDAQRGGWS